MPGNIGHWEIRAARPDDLVAIRALLSLCALPDDDAAEHIEHFLTAWDGDEALIGSIGLEVLGHLGLLRSLAVAESYRGWGVAKDLVGKLLSLANEREIQSIYLLTTTASEFFPQFGFGRIARRSLPAMVRNTREFKELCPDSAIAMVKHF